jgi:chromosome segregation ATPase
MDNDNMMEELRRRLDRITSAAELLERAAQREKNLSDRLDALEQKIKESSVTTPPSGPNDPFGHSLDELREKLKADIAEVRRDFKLLSDEINNASKEIYQQMGSAIDGLTRSMEDKVSRINGAIGQKAGLNELKTQENRVNNLESELEMLKKLLAQPKESVQLSNRIARLEEENQYLRGRLKNLSDQGYISFIALVIFICVLAVMAMS